MRKLLSVLLLFIVIQAFSQEEEKIPRTVLVLPFYNQDLKNTDFDYLSEVLRDNMSSKLQTTDLFNYIDYINIKKKVAELGFKIEDLREDAKAIKTGMELKADIVIVGKYVVLEEKVMIYARAYDIMDNQDVVSSVEGDSGIDIFTLIEDLTKDMARKMALKYPKMNRKEASDTLFLNNYSGVALGSSYEFVKDAVINSRFQYELYPKEKVIVLKGNMTGAYKTNLTVYNFSEDGRLTNIWIKSGDVKSEDKRARLIDERNKLSRVFGHDFEEIDNEVTLWHREKYSFESLSKTMFRGYNWFFYHYFMNDEKVVFEDITGYVSAFKTAIDLSIGGGIIPICSETKNAALLDKYESMDLTTDPFKYVEVRRLSEKVFPVMIQKFGLFASISFSYFYNNRSSVGFVFKAAYLPSIVYPLFDISSPYYFMNTLSFDLRFRQKFLIRRNYNFRFVLEYGAVLDLEFVSKTHSNYVEKDGDFVENIRTSQDDMKKLFGEFFLGAGPVLALGYEQRSKNYTYEFLLFHALTFGAESFEGYNLEIYQEKVDSITGSSYSVGGYNFNIIVGMEFRFNYYYFKKLK